MNSMLEQAILQLTRLSDGDQERIGKKLLAHVEGLGALRTKMGEWHSLARRRKGQCLVDGRFHFQEEFVATLAKAN
jgi:hypothetical protein